MNLADSDRTDDLRCAAWELLDVVNRNADAPAILWAGVSAWSSGFDCPTAPQMAKVWSALQALAEELAWVPDTTAR